MPSPPPLQPSREVTPTPLCRGKTPPRLSGAATASTILFEPPARQKIAGEMGSCRVAGSLPPAGTCQNRNDIALHAYPPTDSYLALARRYPAACASLSLQNICSARVRS